ncbi:MAG TPA: hypothetical protein VGC97_18665 [Pyrinomonadaceae bacterium]|jgi:hypothetical protein
MQNEKEKESREDWSVQELADQASQQNIDEIQRQTLRGDETKGNPDNRDKAGNVDTNETAQGREEAKNDIGDKANANG